MKITRKDIAVFYQRGKSPSEKYSVIHTWLEKKDITFDSKLEVEIARATLLPIEVAIHADQRLLPLMLAKFYTPLEVEHKEQVLRYAIIRGANADIIKSLASELPLGALLSLLFSQEVYDSTHSDISDLGIESTQERLLALLTVIVKKIQDEKDYSEQYISEEQLHTLLRLCLFDNAKLNDELLRSIVLLTNLRPEEFCIAGDRYIFSRKERGMRTNSVIQWLASIKMVAELVELHAMNAYIDLFMGLPSLARKGLYDEARRSSKEVAAALDGIGFGEDYFSQEFRVSPELTPEDNSGKASGRSSAESAKFVAKHSPLFE